MELQTHLLPTQHAFNFTGAFVSCRAYLFFLPSPTGQLIRTNASFPGSSGTLTLSLDPEATSPGRARHIYPLQCTGSQLLVMVCHHHLGVLSSLLPFARVLHQLPRDGNAFSMPSCKPNALLTPGTRCHPPKACNTTSSACLPLAQVKTHTQSAVPPWQTALFLLLAHAASKLPSST